MIARRNVVLTALLAGGLVSVSTTLGLGQSDGPVIRVPVTGVIELGLAPYVERSIKEAAEMGAAAVILDLNTPGGRVDAAERIADAIADSHVPVYAYVNRRAFSAGALISLATEGIFMRPGSVIGAATPVMGTGEKAPEKIVSAMRAEMRTLAELRGLDPDIAAAMVDEEIEIAGVVEKGKLLTLTTEEAVSLGYAQEVEDWDGLMGAIGTQGSETMRMQVNWAERVVRFLSHPVVSPFLLSLGFLGLLVEIKTPGLGLAGGAGALALAMFFGSHVIIGLAGLEDLIVFGTGVVLLGVEAFVIPGFGLFGILGIVAILGGVYMSLLGGFPTMPDFARAGGVLSTSFLVILVTSWALLRHLPKSGRLAEAGVFLLTKGLRDTGWASAERRPELVGQVGTAVSDLRPSGVGIFGEERVDVVTESEWIEEGTAIRIIASEGYRHVVRSVESTLDVPAETVDEPADDSE
ncbi:nodulation protein NfeD [Gemmatimonadota bacterium]